MNEVQRPIAVFIQLELVIVKRNFSFHMIMCKLFWNNCFRIELHVIESKRNLVLLAASFLYYLTRRSAATIEGESMT